MYIKNLLVLFLPFLIMVNPLNAEGVFKWRDKYGKIQYGDKPPKNSQAQHVKLPALTIIQNYKDQWKPLNPIENTASPTANRSQKVPSQRINPSAPRYNSFKLLAPKPNQIIEAKDGDVSSMLSIKPPLQKNHKIVFLLDGKKIRSSKSRIINFQNLPVGSHKVMAQVVDSSGQLIMKTTPLSFKVKRQ